MGYFQWDTDKVNNTNDIVRLVLSILAGIKLLIAALGWNWFTDDILVAIENLIPLFIILYGVWRNNYITDKGKAQKLVLAQKGLTHEDPEDVIKDKS